jgi:hypothetical protein
MMGVEGNSLDDVDGRKTVVDEKSLHIDYCLDEHVRISLDVICCTISNRTVTVLGTRKITVDNFYFHCSPDKS